jgi:hypothetical protein
VSCHLSDRYFLDGQSGTEGARRLEYQSFDSVHIHHRWSDRWYVQNASHLIARRVTKALVYGNSTNTSGIYGTVAAIFLFQGSYSFGWTPLTVLYPPEIMNFSIRANGMAIFSFWSNAIGLLVTFAFPYALAAIEWKTYMINGAWDFLELAFVLYFWVETKGKSLEEIDEVSLRYQFLNDQLLTLKLFDGVKHSDVPDLEAIMRGKADVSDLVLEGVEIEGKRGASVPIKTPKKEDETA